MVYDATGRKKPFEALSHELRITYAQQFAEWRERGCYSGQPCTQDYVHVRLSQISSVPAAAQADADEGEEANMKQPEFVHVQVHCVVDMVVQQCWATAEAQASQVGISQQVLNEVASYMKNAFPCDDETQDQPFFSKAQVQQLIEVLNAECLDALKLALDRALS